MRTLRTTTAIAAALFALAAGAPGATGASSSCWEPKKNERGFKRKINKERASRGRNKLRLDPELSRAARAQTRKMIRDDNLHHTRNLQKRVTNWSTVAENVGVGGTVVSLHGAFMDSDGHRLNVLWDDFRHVGVGTKRDDGGRLWVTVIFTGGKDPGTILKMPSCK